MDARGGCITLAPPKAAAAEAASVEIEGRDPEEEETVAAIFLGRGIGISCDPEALKGRERTTLRATGQRDLPEPLPETCFKPRK